MENTSVPAGLGPVRKTGDRYRSISWTDGDDEVGMSHRVALRLAAADRGKPIIGIADTASDLNPCNLGFRELYDDIADSVRAAGGVPMRFPVMSLGEDLMKPSAMLYRNLVAMELEEQARANPVDGLIFLANCDKSVPAAIMAAASTDMPSLLLLGGARSAPEFRGRRLGTGTDLWRALDDRRAGLLDDAQWAELERQLACAGAGSCNTMGTASTMSLVTEALGMCLPGVTGLQSGSEGLVEIARATATRVVEMTKADIRPSTFLTQNAVDNAAVVIAAIAGSTNAIIHLAAIAGRLGLDATPARMDGLWREVPLVADIEPSGSGLIHDLHRDGGFPTLARSLGDAGLLAMDVTTGSGETLAVVAARAPEPHGVIRSVADALIPAPTLAVLFGTLSPSGSVLKVAAATTELLQHTGKAVVFTSYDDMRTRLDDPSVDINENDVIVVRGVGPIGVPGMPEWGMAPIPQRLVERGVRDIVRISDGRMSGTSFGTVVLHVAPEAAAGGPLALVHDGDHISLDVENRRIDLLVDEVELERRRTAAALVPQPNKHLRGWPKLYQEHVLQAPEGCDLDFLTAATPEKRQFIEPVVGRS